MPEPITPAIQLALATGTPPVYDLIEVARSASAVRRLTSAPDDLTVTLPADAPYGADSTVTFPAGAAVDVKRRRQDDSSTTAVIACGETALLTALEAEGASNQRADVYLTLRRIAGADLAAVEIYRLTGSRYRFGQLQLSGVATADLDQIWRWQRLTADTFPHAAQ